MIICEYSMRLKSLFLGENEKKLDYMKIEGTLSILILIWGKK